MKQVLRQSIFWLGSAVIFALAVPTAALLGAICGLSRLMSRIAGTDTL